MPIPPIIELSPPWYTLANEIKYTYGLSRYVTVNDLVENGIGYELDIDVSNDVVANALRQILPVDVNFGGTNVDIVIKNSSGEIVNVANQAYTPESLGDLFCYALYANPLFVGSVLTSGKLNPIQQGSVGDVVVIIKPCVVQFYNDDISDLCSNYNEVASKVFAGVTILEYVPDLKVSFTTYDKDCQLQKDIYCPICNCNPTCCC